MYIYGYVHIYTCLSHTGKTSVSKRVCKWKPVQVKGTGNRGCHEHELTVRQGNLANCAGVRA